jgi:hypothetical protein
MPTPNTIKDTLPEAESVLIGLLRDRPAPLRLRDAVAASNRVARQCKDAIRRNHPKFSEDEIKLRFIELNYGQEIADEVRAYLNMKS